MGPPVLGPLLQALFVCPPSDVALASDRPGLVQVEQQLVEVTRVWRAWHGDDLGRQRKRDAENGWQAAAFTINEIERKRAGKPIIGAR